MSVSNKSLFLFCRWLIFILVVLIIADLLLARIPGSLSSYFENHYLTYASASLILILSFIRINYFSYEDEYEIIHIRNKSLLFSSLQNPAKIHYEFPKRILFDYEFKSGLLRKTLVLFLKNNQGHIRKRKFNLLFVAQSKRDYVLNSVKAISERNRNEEGDEL